MSIVTIVDNRVPIERLLTRLSGSDFSKPGDFISCPGHPDPRPSLKVNGGRGGWHCFQCGKGGWASAYMALLRGKNLRDGAVEVAKLFMIDLSGHVHTDEINFQERRTIFDTFYLAGFEKAFRESIERYAETQTSSLLKEILSEAGDAFVENYFKSFKDQEMVSEMKNRLWSYLQMVEEAYKEWRKDVDTTSDASVPQPSSGSP